MLTIALNAGRTPPSKEPPSGVSGSSTRYGLFSSPLLGESALFTYVVEQVFSEVRIQGSCIAPVLKGQNPCARPPA